jgi:hypothetical protein
MRLLVSLSNVRHASTHYRNPSLYRVPNNLPSATLHKLRLSVTSLFTECRTLGTCLHSAKTCVPSVKHSANKALGKGPSAAVLKLTAVSLCREPRTDTRQRGFFAECQILGTRVKKTLPSVFYRHSANHIFVFSFWPPKFLWYVPTLCRPTCTILGQF